MRNKYYERNKEFVQLNNTQRAETKRKKKILIDELKVFFKTHANLYQPVTKLAVYKYTQPVKKSVNFRPKVEIIRKDVTVYF